MRFENWQFGCQTWNPSRFYSALIWRPVFPLFQIVPYALSHFLWKLWQFSLIIINCMYLYVHKFIFSSHNVTYKYVFLADHLAKAKFVCSSLGRNFSPALIFSKLTTCEGKAWGLVSFSHPLWQVHWCQPCSSDICEVRLMMLHGFSFWCYKEIKSHSKLPQALALKVCLSPLL